MKLDFILSHSFYGPCYDIKNENGEYIGEILHREGKWRFHPCSIYDKFHSIEELKHIIDFIETEPNYLDFVRGTFKV